VAGVSQMHEGAREHGLEDYPAWRNTTFDHKTQSLFSRESDDRLSNRGLEVRQYLGAKKREPSTSETLGETERMIAITTAEID